MTEPKALQHVRIVPPSSRAHWSRTKMARFLAELAATQSVAAAARMVGMSRQSAYRLKARMRDQPFDLAWEAALQSGYDALHQAALDRALNGVEVPVMHRGEMVGTRRVYDERLTIFLLSGRNGHAVPLSRESREARQAWSGYFADLVARVRAGVGVPQADGAGSAARKAASVRHQMPIGPSWNPLDDEEAAFGAGDELWDALGADDDYGDWPEPGKGRGA